MNKSACLEFQKKMMKKTIYFLIWLGVIAYQANADCCNHVQFVQHNCIGFWCYSYICPDGALILPDDRFCGLGKCNMFGCNCDGGCRRNSMGFDQNEAQILFKERYRTFIKYVK